MPNQIYVANENRRIETLPRIRYCDTFLSQLRGFTFHSRLDPAEGLLLVGKRDSRLDSAIHMLFVSFALTVVWINTNFKVVDKVLAKPWRPAYFPIRAAKYVLELHPYRWNDFEVGDSVKFKDA